MPKVTIDGVEISVEDGLTVLQACEAAGKEIPHFCFHERLNIAGNCRMCLVDIEKSPKPVASCAMPVNEGMVIHTNTPKVKKMREGVMEFLLINHPLDCPICDQGGECDLQDQAFKYGKGGSRFEENKRAVTDKNMGPLIKTQMTRCIHCTRCVRFATEVAGVQEVGAIGRGEHTEITTYLERAVTSELSGNMIDLCPVGALTSKPYAFKARSWELKHTESIDVMDALGSNVRIDSRALEVMRVLPKLNDDVNEEWISDKARFSCDGLKYQRIDTPYIKKNGKLQEASWEEALKAIADKAAKLQDGEIAAIAGQFANCEAMFLLKNVIKELGEGNLCSTEFDYKIDFSSRANYLFNTTVAGIEKADLCLLIGANPRYSSPVLNARIGKMQRAGALKVARIGDVIDQTYKIQELGVDLKVLQELAGGSHPFAAGLKSAKHPMVIVGSGVISREDGHAILSLVHELVKKYDLVREDWNGFNILHNHASAVGSFDTGFVSGKEDNLSNILAKIRKQAIKMVYLLGADELDMDGLSGAFVVYQGHHGDAGAHIADVVLPAAAYTEQDGTYVNLEGRVQHARGAVAPLGKAKADWEIIRSLAEVLKLNSASEGLVELRRDLARFNPIFEHVDTIKASQYKGFSSKEKIDFAKPLLSLPQVNYYLTNPISRASATMAKCVQVREAAKGEVES